MKLRPASASPPAEDQGGISLSPLKTPSNVGDDWHALVWKFLRPDGTFEPFNWNRRLYDGSRLSDPENAGFLEFSRRYLALYCSNAHQDVKEIEWNTAVGRARTLFVIFDFFLYLGISKISEVTFSAWELFQELAPNGLPWIDRVRPDEKLSADRLRFYYEVWQDLAVLPQLKDSEGLPFFADGLGFQPFLRYSDAQTLARAQGRAPRKTENVPKEIVFHYLDCSIRYLYYYSADIIALQAKRRALPVFKPAPACRRGTKLADIASALLRFVDDPSLAPSTGGRIIYTKLGFGSYPTVAGRKLVKACEAIIFRNESVERNLDFIRRRSIPPAPKAEVNRDETIARRIGLPFTGKPGLGAPWPINTISSSRFGADSLDDALAMLWTAIYIVIGTFMGDRIGEVLSLEIGCISYRVDGPYIKYRTSKAANHKGGSLVTQPCPEIVAKAVEVAEELGSAAREKSRTTKLFTEDKWTKSGTVTHQATLRNRLARFGKRAIANTTFESWDIIPREMRLFYVTAWVNYFEFAKHFDALRERLDHKSITTTILYGASAFKGESLSDAQREAAAGILHRVALEGLELNGPFGKKMKKFATLLRVKWMSEEQIMDMIDEFAAVRDLSIHPLPFGYCFWTNAAWKRAKCRRSTSDFDASWPTGKKSEAICGSCENFGCTSAFAAVWALSLERHRKMAANPRAPELLRQAAEAAVVIARHYAEAA